MIQGLACTAASATDLDVLLFGNLDGGGATFFSGGAKMALGSLTESGPVTLVTAGGAMRTERIGCGCGGNHTIRHLVGTSSSALGYQWMLPEGVVAIFAGAETAFDRFDTTGTAMRKGVHIQAEVWLRPTEATLVQGIVIAGTARGEGWARVSWGYRLWDVYVGPEASAYADSASYRKISAGFHVTDLAFADIRFRVAAGLQWATDKRGPLPYVGVSAWAPL